MPSRNLPRPGLPRPFIGATRILIYGDASGGFLFAVRRIAPPDVLDAVASALCGNGSRAVRACRASQQERADCGSSHGNAADGIYHVNVIPTEADFLVVPEVSSERQRICVPIGWSGAAGHSEQSQLLDSWRTLPLALFRTCSHRRCTWRGCAISEDGWKAATGTPSASSTTPSRCRPRARTRRNWNRSPKPCSTPRAVHPGATLADLYDPDLMPPNLRRAHRALDRAVDRLYRRSGFASERERVEHLFMLYEKMHTPLAVRTKKRVRRRSGSGTRRP